MDGTVPLRGQHELRRTVGEFDEKPVRRDKGKRGGLRKRSCVNSGPVHSTKSRSGYLHPTAPLLGVVQ